MFNRYPGAIRADRLLRILLLLQTRGRMTAGELAGTLEVSVRTVQRDMESLSAAGVPVYALRGGQGGWALVEGFRTTLTGLTPAEAMAVAVGRPESVLKDLGIAGGGDAGLLKVVAALPELSQQLAEHARQRVHVDLEPWGGQAEKVRAVLGALYQATATDQVAEVRYGSSDPFEIQPLGLVAKGLVWYLVALRGGKLRTTESRGSSRSRWRTGALYARRDLTWRASGRRPAQSSSRPSRRSW